jgi:hypothetical protein
VRSTRYDGPYWQQQRLAGSDIWRRAVDACSPDGRRNAPTASLSWRTRAPCRGTHAPTRCCRRWGVGRAECRAERPVSRPRGSHRRTDRPARRPAGRTPAPFVSRGARRRTFTVVRTSGSVAATDRTRATCLRDATDARQRTPRGACDAGREPPPHEVHTEVAAPAPRGVVDCRAAGGAGDRRSRSACDPRQHAGRLPRHVARLAGADLLHRAAPLRVARRDRGVHQRRVLRPASRRARRGGRSLPRQVHRALAVLMCITSAATGCRRSSTASPGRGRSGAAAGSPSGPRESWTWGSTSPCTRSTRPGSPSASPRSRRRSTRSRRGS